MGNGVNIAPLNGFSQVMFVGGSSLGGVRRKEGMKGKSHKVPSMRFTERYEYLLLELRSLSKALDISATINGIRETGRGQASKTYSWVKGYAGAWRLIIK